MKWSIILVLLVTCGVWVYILFKTELTKARHQFSCSKEWRPSGTAYCKKLYGKSDEIWDDGY